MVSIAYPTTLPLDEISQIITIAKAGTVVADREVFAKCLWVIQGYAQGMLLGDPAAAVIGKYSLGTKPDVLVETLEMIVAQHSGQITAQALPLPVALLLKLVVQALISLLNAELGLGL